MKKFILKQWYPSLPNGIEVGHIIEFDRKANLPNGDKVELYLLRRKPVTFIMERELHPDFWELIEEEKPKPLFITEDGVDVMHISETRTWAVDRYTLNKAGSGFLNGNSPNYIYFAHESNADEYIWRNKRLFSYNDIEKYQSGGEGAFYDIKATAIERSKK